MFLFCSPPELQIAQMFLILRGRHSTTKANKCPPSCVSRGDLDSGGGRRPPLPRGVTTQPERAGRGPEAPTSARVLFPPADRPPSARASGRAGSGPWSVPGGTHGWLSQAWAPRVSHRVQTPVGGASSPGRSHPLPLGPSLLWRRRSLNFGVHCSITPAWGRSSREIEDDFNAIHSTLLRITNKYTPRSVLRE